VGVIFLLLGVWVDRCSLVCDIYLSGGIIFFVWWCGFRGRLLCGCSVMSVLICGCDVVSAGFSWMSVSIVVSVSIDFISVKLWLMYSCGFVLKGR